MNAMAAKTSVKASVPSLHDKPYSSLGLCVPEAILEDSTFNNQRHVLVQCTLASVDDSSARRAVCIIYR